MFQKKLKRTVLNAEYYDKSFHVAIRLKILSYKIWYEKGKNQHVKNSLLFNMVPIY